MTSVKPREAAWWMGDQPRVSWALMRDGSLFKICCSSVTLPAAATFEKIYLSKEQNLWFYFSCCYSCMSCKTLVTIYKIKKSKFLRIFKDALLFYKWNWILEILKANFLLPINNPLRHQREYYGYLFFQFCAFYIAY